MLIVGITQSNLGHLAAFTMEKMAKAFSRLIGLILMMRSFEMGIGKLGVTEKGQYAHLGMHIVVAGDPVYGFEFYGPFRTLPDALEWADEHLDTDWWAAPLQIELENEK